ncbi:SDR family NAD(P)-dependent oxidoreductase [Streptomyces sp. NPDC003016]
MPLTPPEPVPPATEPLSIAVIGCSSLLPGSVSIEGFWRDVLYKRDQMREVPDTHWLPADYFDSDPAAPDKTYARRGAFLPPVAYDPLAFATPPATLEATDTAQLLSLVAAERALHDAFGDAFAQSARERTGVVIGTGALELSSHMSSRLQRPVWLKALRECGVEEQQAQQVCDRITDHYVPWQEATFPGLLSNVVAGRIANRFDLHGINHTTDAACASSLAALSVAVDQLALGRADVMLAGGVDTLNDPTMYVCFSETTALSPSGDCRPFSEDADGTMLGEGLVMFVLKRLSDAERDHDRVYAVLRGLGSSSDGRGSAVYAPDAAGQIRALDRAYDMAGYSPGTVELVEAHGTGTTVGDATEFEALRRVFTGAGRTDRPWCALGSVKSQIGHTKSAAGAAGLLKAVLALHHKILPPTIKVKRPNPRLDLASSPLYLNTEARPWVRADDHPRRASVSSFGFGGSNFHLTLEEYRPASRACSGPAGGKSQSRRGATGGTTWRLRSAPSELVVVDADSTEELLRRARRLHRDHATLADAARAGQHRFDPTAAVRLALICSDAADLEENIRRAAVAVEAGRTHFSLPGGKVHFDGRPATADAPGDLAYVFSGQGSQYLGMGADLAMTFPEALDAWDRTAWLQTDGAAIHHVVFPPPAFTDEEARAQETLLTGTRWAQPTLAVAQMAQLRLLTRLGLSPDCVIGHSFGELVALHAAGVYGETDLVRLAAARGELMAAAARTEGAMLALTGAVGGVDDLLTRLGGQQIWVANFNSPTQTVLSGSVQAITWAEQEARQAGFSTHRLQASAAFHSPLVASAVKPFTACLENTPIASPHLPVYANKDGGIYPAGAARIRDRLAEHLVSPVHFARGIESMYAAGVRTFVEVGAGSALSGLVGQILADRPHLAVSLDRRGCNGVTAFHTALGRLAAAGVRLDFDELWTSYDPAHLRLPKEKSAMATEILGTNYKRPYPPPGGADALPAADPRSGSDTGGPPSPCAAQPSPQAFEETPSHCAARSAAEQAAVPAGEAVAVHSTAMYHWLSTFEQVQHHNSEAHSAYNRAMAESHMAFMRTAESSLNGLTSALGRTVVPPGPAADDLFALSAAEQEPMLSAEPEPLVPPEPGLPPEPESAAVVSRAPAEAAAQYSQATSTQAVSPAPGPVPGPAPVTMATPASASGESVSPEGSADVSVRRIEDRLLQIVAEQTRYPREMLDATMDLEADLGVDSIKRVQMLARIRSDVPDLPDVDTADLTRLRTVGEIAARFATARGSRAQASGTASDDGDDSESDPNTPLLRIVHHCAEAPAPGFRLPGLFGRTLRVTDDGAGVAPALVDILAARGQSACVVDEVPSDAEAVLHLGGLRAVTSTESALAVLQDAFTVARRIAAHAARSSGVFVVVQDTGGEFAVSGTSGQPILGGLAPLARTAALEWPSATVKAVDCARDPHDPRVTARRLADELLEGGDEPNVGLRQDGTRVLLGTTAAPFTEPTASTFRGLGPDSVLLVTGGGRGVTAACMRHLAAAHRPRLALIGRTPLEEESPALRETHGEGEMYRALLHQARTRNGGAGPSPAAVRAQARAVLASREIRATLHALRQAGAQARYYTADTTDREALRQVVDDVHAAWGPVTGIIHGAAVIADKEIAEKTDEQFARVLGTKVHGLLALLDAVGDDPLDLLCLFSSVSAWTGNAGQCDYAMANEALEHLAMSQAAERPGCRVKAIAWGPWQGGMVTPDLADHFRRQGLALIPVPAGAQAFVHELEAPAGNRVLISPTALYPGPSGGIVRRRTTAGDVVVSRDSHPHLLDHAIDGTPVIPLVLGAEWILRATCGRRLTDLEVLRRMALEAGGRGHPLVVALRVDSASDGSRVAHLSQYGPAPSYRALLPVDPCLPEPPDFDVADDDTGTGICAPYAARSLFHGPSFQVIERIRILGRAGAHSTVRGLREADWPREPWHTDVAAMDGALQTAVLWVEHTWKRITVPMGVEDYLLHATGPAPGPVRCSVRPVSVRSSELTCDIALWDEHGTPRAQMRGVTLVTRPS